MNSLKVTFHNVWQRLKRIAARLARGEGEGDFYINGPDALPPPLSSDEEAAVICRLETDKEARRILIEHNLRLVVYIARKFESTGTGIEDLISIGTIGLIKAINTYRSDKNIKLATYASRCI
ncbi:MAG: sporulation sigma factor SigE, partial [Clostridia bacterium]|nr:sporulation sigma factor SigE [Clostridia bacterium]